MKPLRTIGVVLARAGSKGLPDKHLIPLLGRTLISYTLDHANAARRLDAILVTSDCPIVLSLGASHGHLTRRRPAELATDSASVQDVLLDALDHAERSLADRFDAVVTLYGNVPVRPPFIVDRAIDLLENTGCDSVRSFAGVGKWHPRWMSRLDEAGRAHPLHAGSVHRRQDLEPLFLHDGAVVVSSRRAMEAGRANRDDPHAFFGTDRRAVLSDPDLAVEVDSRRDLLLAEAVLRDHVGELRKSA